MTNAALEQILDEREKEIGYRETVSELWELIQPSWLELCPEEPLPTAQADIEQAIVDFCEPTF